MRRLLLTLVLSALACGNANPDAGRTSAVDAGLHEPPHGRHPGPQQPVDDHKLGARVSPAPVGDPANYYVVSRLCTSGDLSQGNPCVGWEATLNASVNGYEAYFPPGWYALDLNTPLLLPSGTRLRGAGMGRSYITTLTAHVGNAINSLFPPNTTNAANTHISDLEIVNKVPGTNSHGIGIYQVDGSFLFVDHVRFDNWWSGMALDQTEISWVTNCDFEEVGAYTNATPQPTSIVITQGGAAGATSYSYAVNAVAPGGNKSLAFGASTSSGNATLTGVNFNTITWGTAPTGGNSSFAKASTTVTLTTSSTTFTSNMVGASVTVASATSAGNNGTFVITGVPSITTITYTNASGVAEAGAGTWIVKPDHYEIWRLYGTSRGKIGQAIYPTVTFNDIGGAGDGAQPPQATRGLWLVDGGDIIEGHASGFTNAVWTDQNNYNMGDPWAIGVLDDGGLARSVSHSQFNGGGTGVWMSGSSATEISNDYFEAQQGIAVIRLTGFSYDSNRAVGGPANTVIAGNFIQTSSQLQVGPANTYGVALAVASGPLQITQNFISGTRPWGGTVSAGTAIIAGNYLPNAAFNTLDGNRPANSWWDQEVNGFCLNCTDVHTSSHGGGLEIRGPLATRYAVMTLANGTNDDVDPDTYSDDSIGAVEGGSIYRVTGLTGAGTITSIKDGYDGRLIKIYNATSQTLTIANQAVSGTAANRIITGTGGNSVFPAGGTADLWYSFADSRWILDNPTGPLLSSVNTWSKSQNVTSAALTASSHAYATDSTLSNVFTLTLENAQADTLPNPTGLVAGGTYLWVIAQNGTGVSTLAYGTNFSFSGGTPVITATLGAIDAISCVYDGVKLRCAWLGNYQ